ncbi:MAG: hypothetical protein WBQ75_01610 [Acetobacteraceae bacterium]
MTTDTMIRRALLVLCLLIAPLGLIAIELFHPANFTTHPGMYQFLSHAEHDEANFKAIAYFGPDWWFILHMVQTPLVGLVAIGLWMLVDMAHVSDDWIALVLRWLARVAIFVFLIYYTVLDGIGGIGLGRTILTVQRLQSDGTLTPQQVDGVALVLNRVWTDPWVGGVGSFVSKTGSWAAFASAVFVAGALRRARVAGWLTVVALLAFGWELQTSHASPHGPAAFLLLIIASCALWWRHRGRPTVAVSY